MKTTPSRLGSAAEDYERIGISPDQVAPWEDGARTGGEAGTYEWWYFDAHLDDGAKLVVVFSTKNFTDIAKPLAPTIRIDLDLPDGTSRNLLGKFAPEEFSASDERCDVRIGANVFSGDLHDYKIVAEVDDVAVEISLTGEVPAWRPATGHMYYGADDEHEFDWLPAVPQGKVTATYRVAGTTSETSGVGYHDHNWGNAPMTSLVNNWYWARGQAGPYSVIASFVTAEQKYGYAEIPIFMLAENGKVIADDAGKLTFERLGGYTTPPPENRSPTSLATPTATATTATSSPSRATATSPLTS